MIPSYPISALGHALTCFPRRGTTDDADLHPWPLHYSLPYKHRAVPALQHPALQALHHHGPTLAAHLDALPPSALLMRPHGSAHMGRGVHKAPGYIKALLRAAARPCTQASLPYSQLQTLSPEVSSRL